MVPPWYPFCSCSSIEVENTVDMQVILQYAPYLVEHLADILLHLRNPLRKAAFFGDIFNTPPSYEDLVGGTQKTAQIPGVNELFQIGCFENPLMVTLLNSKWNEVCNEIIRWRELENILFATAS